MREIEYRAWLKGERKMVEVKTIHFGTRKIMYGYSAGSQNYGNASCGFDDCEIMQFTGLKDKNGVKIYEGDIVEFEGHGFIPLINKGVVVFHEGSYCIGYESKYFGDTGFHRIGEVSKWQDMSASGEITYTYEIIGNIYDNPELIKESE